MIEFFSLQTPSIFFNPESELIKDLSRLVTLTYLNENETILLANTRQENIFFIVRGYVRSYLKRGDGSETTCWFFGKGDVAFSDSSVSSNRRSRVTLQAACPTQAFQISMADFHSLRRAYPEFNEICLNLEGSFHARLFDYAHSLLRLPREARFETFLDRNPRIIGQVKEKDIASFLHMHPNSFSGLKKESVRKSARMNVENVL